MRPARRPAGGIAHVTLTPTHQPPVAPPRGSQVPSPFRYRATTCSESKLGPQNPLFLSPWGCASIGAPQADNQQVTGPLTRRVATTTRGQQVRRCPLAHEATVSVGPHVQIPSYPS